MHKFKAGDKIRMTTTCSGAIEGKIYTLQKKDTDGTRSNIGPWAWDQETKKIDYSCGCYCEKYWELITKKNTMTKVNTMMKKILDKDTRTLIKADFINGDLQLTEEGKEALHTLLFTDKKTELVELAKEVIKENKEEEK